MNIDKISLHFTRHAKEFCFKYPGDVSCRGFQRACFLTLEMMRSVAFGGFRKADEVSHLFVSLSQVIFELTSCLLVNGENYGQIHRAFYLANRVISVVDVSDRDFPIELRILFYKTGEKRAFFEVRFYFDLLGGMSAAHLIG